MPDPVRTRLSFLFPSRFDKRSGTSLRKYLAVVKETQIILQLHGDCEPRSDVNDLENDYVMKYANYALMGLVYYNLEDWPKTEQYLTLCLQGFNMYKFQRTYHRLYLLLCNCYLSCCSIRQLLYEEAEGYLNEFDRIHERMTSSDEILKPDSFFAGLLELFCSKTMNQARNEVIDKSMFLVYDYLAVVHADDKEKFACFAVKRLKHALSIDESKVDFENAAEQCLLLADRVLRRQHFRLARRLTACADYFASSTQKINVLRQWFEYGSVLLHTSLEHRISARSTKSMRHEKASEYFEYLFLDNEFEIEKLEKVISDKLLVTDDDLYSVRMTVLKWHGTLRLHYKTEGQLQELHYINCRLKDVNELMIRVAVLASTRATVV